MINLEVLRPEQVLCGADARSKKHVFEMLGELLATATPGLQSGDIFDSLAQREKLGNTAIGSGVAIPHGRASGIDHPVGAFIRLKTPQDFDAVDGQPVDLVFALLVPRDTGENHVSVLGRLTELFSSGETLGHLRDAGDREHLHAILAQALATARPQTKADP